MTLTLTTLTALTLLSGPARADAGAAEVDTCLRLVGEEKLPEGLRPVSRQNHSIATGAEEVYAVTLFAGNSYTFATCTAAAITDVDLALYDQSGKLVIAATETDRQPGLVHKPSMTGTHYLVVSNVAGPDGSVGFVQLYE